VSGANSYAPDEIDEIPAGGEDPAYEWVNNRRRRITVYANSPSPKPIKSNKTTSAHSAARKPLVPPAKPSAAQVPPKPTEPPTEQAKPSIIEDILRAALPLAKTKSANDMGYYLALKIRQAFYDTAWTDWTDHVRDFCATASISYLDAINDFEQGWPKIGDPNAITLKDAADLAIAQPIAQSYSDNEIFSFLYSVAWHLWVLHGHKRFPLGQTAIAKHIPNPDGKNGKGVSQKTAGSHLKKLLKHKVIQKVSHGNNLNGHPSEYIWVDGIKTE